MSVSTYIGQPRRRPRLIHVLVAIALGFLVIPSRSAAQETSADVSGVKVVVPQARGRRNWGRDQLTASIRKTIGDGALLLDPGDYTQAQKKLKIRGRAANRPQNMARAARAIGAQFVLDVRISRQRWLYTATARLIDAETGEEKMNFRSQYYKPRAEAEDRGFRIATRTLQKLGTLLESGEIPGMIASQAVERPGRDPMAFVPPADIADPKDDTSSPQDDPFGRVDQDEPDQASSTRSSDRDDDALAAHDSAGSSGFAPPPPAEAPFSPESSGSGTTSQFESTPPTTTAVSEPAPTSFARPLEVLRISISAGAEFVRAYDVTSDAVTNSELSHALSPLGLVSAEIEAIVPDIPFFFRTSASFRPVNYSLDVQNSVPVEGSGILLNALGLVGYQIALSGNERSSIRLIPSAGIRLALSSAAAEINDVVLSSTSLAAIGGLTFRWPLNDVLELDIGVDGGYVFSYSESPTTTGNDGAGFVVGGDLSAQIWLTDTIGILVDNRFVFESVSFKGAPTRAVQESEQAGLTDATVSTRDLFTSVGVIFRL